MRLLPVTIYTKNVMKGIIKGLSVYLHFNN